MKLLKRFGKLWGTRFFITEVEEGLKEDEIIIRGHRVYIKGGILNAKSKHNK